MMSNSRCELQDDRQIPFLIIFHVEAELENTTHGIHVLEPVETYRTSTPWMNLKYEGWSLEGQTAYIGSTVAHCRLLNLVMTPETFDSLGDQRHNLLFVGHKIVINGKITNGLQQRFSAPILRRSQTVTVTRCQNHKQNIALVEPGEAEVTAASKGSMVALLVGRTDVHHQQLCGADRPHTEQHVACLKNIVVELGPPNFLIAEEWTHTHTYIYIYIKCIFQCLDVSFLVNSISPVDLPGSASSGILWIWSWAPWNFEQDRRIHRYKQKCASSFAHKEVAWWVTHTLLTRYHPASDLWQLVSFSKAHSNRTQVL